MDGTGDLLLAAARALRRRTAEALAGWDVSPGQARALRVIAAAEPDAPLRLSALAERLRIVPRSTTEVVDALEHRGLVSRRPDPSDRRAMYVVLTEEGTRLLALIEKARDQAADEQFAVLTTSERAQLDTLLARLSEQPDPRPHPPG